MEATALDISADPGNPKPGEQTSLTVTVSGSRGGDHYGIKGVTVDLKVTDSPASDTSVDPQTVTTDASGAATAKLQVSKTKGRNAVTATVGAVSSEFAVDTLLGTTGTLTRSRHSGVLESTPTSAPKLDPMMLFTGAVLVLLASFLIPYRHRLVAIIRSGRAPRKPFGPADTRARRAVAASRRTAGATRKSAAAGSRGARSAATAGARGVGWKASSGPGKKT